MLPVWARDLHVAQAQLLRAPLEWELTAPHGFHGFGFLLNIELLFKQINQPPCLDPTTLQVQAAAGKAVPGKVP